MHVLDSVDLLGLSGPGTTQRAGISLDGENIGSSGAARGGGARRLLAMPAMANAHDHARPLSPTSFGGAGKPLESWILSLAAMPSVDPYLAACAAFGRAARGGCASVMAHCTRLQGPMPAAD